MTSLTILQGLTGHHLAVVSISQGIVATHLRLVVTIGVQVGQVSMGCLHVHCRGGVSLRIPIDPILHLVTRERETEDIENTGETLVGMNNLKWNTFQRLFLYSKITLQRFLENNLLISNSKNWQVCNGGESIEFLC